MVGVDGYGKQRAGLPLEGVLAAAAFLPDLGAAPALQHVEDLVVDVPLGVDGAPARDLQYVHTGAAVRAVQLDERAEPARPLPWRPRDLPHIVDADASVDRQSFLLHEQVVWC